MTGLHFLICVTGSFTSWMSCHSKVKWKEEKEQWGQQGRIAAFSLWKLWDTDHPPSFAPYQNCTPNMLHLFSPNVFFLSIIWFRVFRLCDFKILEYLLLLHWSWETLFILCVFNMLNGNELNLTEEGWGHLIWYSYARNKTYQKLESQHLRADAQYFTPQPSLTWVEKTT